MAHLNERTKAQAGYCAYCGRPLEGGHPAAERFGERFCSDEHADAFASGVRSTRLEAAARAAASGPGSVPGRKGRGRVGSAGVLAVVVGLLAVGAVLFAGNGGGALVSGGGVLLTVLILLTCPLGMYFMMRGMRHGDSHDHSDHGENARR